MQWVMAATLICGLGVFTSCSIDDNPADPGREEKIPAHDFESLYVTSQKPTFIGDLSAMPAELQTAVRERFPNQVGSIEEAQVVIIGSANPNIVAAPDKVVAIMSANGGNVLTATHGDSDQSLSAMPPRGLSVNFRNCVVDNRGRETPPIVFNNGSSQFDFGGASFSNVTVLADKPDVVEFFGMTGVGVTNVSGCLSMVAPDGRSADLSMEAFAATHKPDPAAGAFRAAAVYQRSLVVRSPNATPSPNPLFCRGRQMFVQKVPCAGRWKFRFIARKVSAGNGGHPIDVGVEIRDREGTLVDSFAMKETEREYELESARDNVYLFTVNSRINECAILSPYPGHGIRADSQLRVHPENGRNLWFVVPAESKKVAFELMAAPSRPLTAKVIDKFFT